ncbi:MFS family permease [Actinoalloteichus hoggarensis]|uniref:Enterobactin exporter EntS n=1 Tax=Actinoalloteichus hoggarensis TaxID=1470176 RepID=A0A221W5B5_9PSEU|nr:MFS transporter [Actinoalloteichus hoggarensis]ASO21110.1 enterobactin exporter EntS [Actinoalloteichus hoggarensis]MBB5921039.1 MFS family permease [Actinoalloteichus hoggarensis]
MGNGSTAEPASPEPERSRWSRDFRLWVGSRTISSAGTEALAVVIPVLVYRQSGSAALTGAASALLTLPYLLFGLFAGALADRVNRRGLMVLSDLVAAAAVVSVPVAALTGSLSTVHVLVVAFVAWTAFVWFDAAAWGTLVSVVGRDRLVRANSVIWSFGITAGIAMPAVAGVVSSAAHPGVMPAVSGVTYAVSAILILRIRTNLDPVSRATPPLGQTIRDGLAFLWRTVEIRLVTLASVGLTLSSGAVIGILVVHLDRNLGIAADDWRVGLFFAAGAVGALAATVLLPWSTRLLGAGRLSAAAFSLYVPALLGVALAGHWLLSLGCWAVWYCTNTLAVVNGVTLRQQLTPEELQGRVNTSSRMIALGGTPVGAILGGVLAESVGVRATQLWAIVPVALAALVLWLSRVRRLRMPT